MRALTRLALAGCTSTGGDTDDTDDSDAGTPAGLVTAAEGGWVESDDGVLRVDVPPGAVD